MGIPITVSVLATVEGDPPYEVKRTWKERWTSADLDSGPWYSRPWLPWIRTRTITPPRKPAIYKTPQGWIVHPAMLEVLKRYAAELTPLAGR